MYSVLRVWRRISMLDLPGPGSGRCPEIFLTWSHVKKNFREGDRRNNSVHVSLFLMSLPKVSWMDKSSSFPSLHLCLLHVCDLLLSSLAIDRQGSFVLRQTAEASNALHETLELSWASSSVSSPRHFYSSLHALRAYSFEPYNPPTSSTLIYDPSSLSQG